MIDAWKKDAWHCKRISGDNAEKPIFDAPIHYKGKTANGINYQPTKGYLNVLLYGEKITEYMTAILTPFEKWYGVIKTGDRFYLDGAEPSEDESYFGEKANYLVDFVGNQNKAIKVIFRKI